MPQFGTQQEELREIQRRLTILKIALLAIVGLLALRLWDLQIRDGAYYRDLSENNRTRTVILEPARGLIYDRQGVLLANNVPSFGLYVTLEDVKDRKALVDGLVGLIGLDETALRKKLSERGSKLLPRKLKDGLSLREAALIESHRLDLPGVMIQADSQRNYPSGPILAHVLGYVGQVSAEQLEKPESQELHQGSMVGQYGVEKAYDRFLRGQAGQKTIEVDALGHEKRTVSVEKPAAGDDLYLSIDLRLQRLAEELLGDEAGAIVALDPTNGEVLALASRPSFDPNVLSRELTAKQWDEPSDPGAVSAGVHLQDRDGDGRAGIAHHHAVHENSLCGRLSLRPAGVQGLEGGRPWVHGRHPGSGGVLRRVLLHGGSAHGHRHDRRLRGSVRPGTGNRGRVAVRADRHRAVHGLESESEGPALAARRDDFGRHRAGVCDRDADADGAPDGDGGERRDVLPPSDRPGGHGAGERPVA
jgi:hypothetical protein